MNQTHFSQVLFLSTTMFTFKLLSILSSSWLHVFIAILSSLQNRKQGTNTGIVVACKKQIF